MISFFFDLLARSKHMTHSFDKVEEDEQEAPRVSVAQRCCRDINSLFNFAWNDMMKKKTINQTRRIHTYLALLTFFPFCFISVFTHRTFQLEKWEHDTHDRTEHTSSGSFVQVCWVFFSKKCVPSKRETTLLVIGNTSNMSTFFSFLN